MEGLRTPAELVMRVMILLAYGCPLQAIVHAFGVDERTVAAWQKRAGKHCQQVHHAIVEQGGWRHTMCRPMKSASKATS